jgi:hypothetical protein
MVIKSVADGIPPAPVHPVHVPPALQLPLAVALHEAAKDIFGVSAAKKIKNARNTIACARTFN